MKSVTLFALVASMVLASNAARAADPLSTEQMMADIQRYESFGLHRYGSGGAKAALDWIGSELGKAGLKTSSQPFTMRRQYNFGGGSLDVGGKRLTVLPQWWMPEHPAQFSLSAAIAPSGDASGRFARVNLPFDRGAYLNDSHRAKLEEAFARHPAAVLLVIDHPSGEIFTYNVEQRSKSWPVPVILVAPKYRPLLDAAERSGEKIAVEISGRYTQDVESYNVVARLDRNKDKWLVISTPVTSWFTSTCERGPGIAGFLAMARLAAERFTEADLIFVATAGHEIGHGGMGYFMTRGAPPPRDTIAWAHFGSSLACRDTLVKAINSSESLAPLVTKNFAGIEGTRLTGEKAAVGELREVNAAGYTAFFGMAAAHKYFHTPLDSAATVDPALLSPMAKAFADTLSDATKR